MKKSKVFPKKSVYTTFTHTQLVDLVQFLIQENGNLLEDLSGWRESLNAHSNKYSSINQGLVNKVFKLEWELSHLRKTDKDISTVSETHASILFHELNAMLFYVVDEQFRRSNPKTPSHVAVRMSQLAHLYSSTNGDKSFRECKSRLVPMGRRVSDSYISIAQSVKSF